MPIPTVALNEDTPAGGSYVRSGDDRIREYKQQVREILTIDHYFPSSGQNDACGRHKWMTLIEAADIGTGADGVPILGAQLVGIIPELCYTNQDDYDVIITSGTKIALQNARLPNATYLIARNAAGAADVNMFKVNASDIIEFATFPITPTALPDADYEVANKKYVDDAIDTDVAAAVAGIGSLLGAWVDKSGGYGAQQAATDGFLTVMYSNSSTLNSSGVATGYTDAAANPTTQRGQAHYNYATNTDTIAATSFTIPVKKNDYWKVVKTDTFGSPPALTVYWIPLGA